MATIGDQIRDVRKALSLTQKEFSAALGMSENYIWQIEKGQRVPGSRTISDICRVFGVNEKWLRSGEGKMFLPRPRGEEIGDIVKAAARHDPEEAAKFFRTLLEDMSDAEIVLLHFRLHCE